MPQLADKCRLVAKGIGNIAKEDRVAQFRVVQRVFFGEWDDKKWHDPIGDVTVLDKVALAILSVWMIALGIFPVIMEPMIRAGMEPVARLLGGA